MWTKFCTYLYIEKFYISSNDFFHYGQIISDLSILTKINIKDLFCLYVLPHKFSFTIKFTFMTIANFYQTAVIPFCYLQQVKYFIIVNLIEKFLSITWIEPLVGPICATIYGRIEPYGKLQWLVFEIMLIKSKSGYIDFILWSLTRQTIRYLYKRWSRTPKADCDEHMSKG